jgi:hypothetical protein
MSRERAIFLAIGALYDVADKCNDGPTRPTLSLRAILAFLYLQSNGDKEPFNSFWRECQNEWKNESQPGYMRATYTRIQIERIVSAVGMGNVAEWPKRINETRAQDRRSM